jgi:hypothetical protein
MKQKYPAIHRHLQHTSSMAMTKLHP